MPKRSATGKAKAGTGNKKKRNRGTKFPEWAVKAGITEEQWKGGTKKRRKCWFSQMARQGDVVVDGPKCKPGPKTKAALHESDDEVVHDMHGDIAVVDRVYHREYCIADLDLSLAGEAQAMHSWKDQHCVDQLMLLLTQGNGTLRFRTYFAHLLDRGRLFLIWPTLLHVNKEFRAILLYIQAALYTDLDMTNAHSNICKYLALGVGVEMAALHEYILGRHAMRKMLTDQGVKDSVAKKLWLAMLNSGTLRGWLFRLRQKTPYLRVVIPNVLKKHCLALQDQVLAVRSLVLAKSPWKEIYDDMVAFNSTEKKNCKSVEQVKRAAWNCVLCTVESQVVAALETHIEQNTCARVCMPSYDGLLLRHPANAFEWNDQLCNQWQDLCMVKWGFVFPVEKKDYLDHMPKWMLEILRLRAVIEETGS